MRQTQLCVVQSLTLGAGAGGGQGEAVAQTETLNGGGQSSRERVQSDDFNVLLRTKETLC